MWSRFNDSSIEPNKGETLRIKEFGTENNYEKLIAGSFNSDECDGWQFLAISFTKLGGIEVCRVTTNNLEKYMHLTSVYENKNASEIVKLKQKTVDCEIHVFGTPAFVCQHLNLKTLIGLEEAFEITKGMELDEEDDFQALCDEFENIRSLNYGWDDYTTKLANIKVVCEECYFQLEEFNKKFG